MSTSLYPNISERSILLIVGMVQFVNILDFMMVMPLGPDFGQVLGIANTDLGWIGGSYTAASAVAGIISSTFIDRLDRKTALLVAIFGLIVATTLGGFAWNFHSLLACRILAGLFGGPATSIAWSIVADTVPPERRGEAMGKVMGAFSLAAVFGVPFGLEMAHLDKWSTPFFCTSLMGCGVMLIAYKLMPAMRAHLALHVHQHVSLRYLLHLALKPLNALTYFYIILAMLASFMIIPNISAYVQFNLHYPRANLGWLYSIGGMVSFFTLRITGKLIDRLNASTTSFISMLTYITVLWLTFIRPLHHMSVMMFFTLFMFAMGMRNVSSTTLATKIPTPEERAGFMSLMSCVQGAGMAAGAFLSTKLLTENNDGSLNGMEILAVIAAAISLLVPVLMRLVEQNLAKPQ